MKMYVCRIFEDRVNVFEADVRDCRDHWEMTRVGVVTSIPKNDRTYIVGTLEQISKNLESMLLERRKILKKLLSMTNEDIVRCRNIQAGVTRMVTGPVPGSGRFE